MMKSGGRGAVSWTLTPAAGVCLAIGVGGMLWTGVAVGMHLIGAF